MKTETYEDMEELHPIDIVEHIAESNEWDFDRITDDQIAMAIEGQWRTYSITLAWSAYDQTLRLICTFEMEPPEERINALYELINRVNDMCWAGAFTFWQPQKLMVWRYGLILTGESIASPEQIGTMVNTAVVTAERFYPAFPLVCWGDKLPSEAVQVAITEAYGRA